MEFAVMKVVQSLSSSLLAFILFITSVSAQQTPEEANLPWHGYYAAERFETSAYPFSSIIGNGGVFVPGSEDLDPYTNNQTVTVPLPFRFLLNREGFSNDFSLYQNLQVGITGVVSMNKGGPDEPIMINAIGPYHLAPTPVQNNPAAAYFHLLAPFWGEFTSSGVLQGGIYTKHEYLVDRQVFTIEWHVRPLDWGEPPAGILIDSGRSFQIKFVRFDDMFRMDNYWIEYHYDDAGLVLIEPIPSAPDHYGAFVGMKNEGQDIGQPYNNTSLPSGDGVDGTRLYIVTHPSQFPSNNPTTYTRLPTRVQNSVPYIPDFFASSPLNQTQKASPLYHYSFPSDKGHRSKPIEQDVATIGIGGQSKKLPEEGLDSAILNDTSYMLFPINDTIYIGGVFVNQGTTSVSDIPVRALIQRNGILVQQIDTMVNSLNFAGRKGIVFPGPLGSEVSKVPGHYVVSVISNLPGDEDRTNDTMTFHLTVQDSVDLTPVGILSPRVYQGIIGEYYPTNSAIPVTGRFVNSGMTMVSGVPLRARILDRAGGVLYQADTIISERWNPMEAKDIMFPAWQTGTTGSFRVELESLFSLDDIESNNHLDVADTRIRWRRFLAANEGRPSASFEVLHASEIEVGRPGTMPHLPRSRTRYGNSVPVMISLRNNSPSTVFGLPVRVIIRNQSNQIVYNQSVDVDSIIGGKSLYYQVFPNLTNASPGIYQLQVEAKVMDDAIPTNDTASWTFVVDSVSSAVDDRGENPAGGILLTNPARNLLGVTWQGKESGEVAFTLFDLRGRGVKRFAPTRVYPGRKVELDVRELSQGAYLLRIVSPSGELIVRNVMILR